MRSRPRIRPRTPENPERGRFPNPGFGDRNAAVLASQRPRSRGPANSRRLTHTPSRRSRPKASLQRTKNMPRRARVMFEGAPFHVTHRGNHKRDVFDDDRDRSLYLALLRRYAKRFEMAVWGYALMKNHVHLIVVGQSRTSIPQAVGNAHREYSRGRNQPKGVTGHLWANRYFSTALDEPHLWA